MEVKLGKEYVPDLLKRLKREDISHKGLSREMGIDPAQFSRWANGHIQPDVNSIIKIERTIAKILKRRGQA
jgi:transcriptional regulator with XRE-family HTH domain